MTEQLLLYPLSTDLATQEELDALASSVVSCDTTFIRIGKDASVGDSASGEGNDAIAIGNGAIATGDPLSTTFNIAIGVGAKSENGGSIAIGNAAESTGEDGYSIVIGNAAIVSGASESNIAIGTYATAIDATDAIAIGTDAVVKADGAGQIGEGINFTADTLQFRDKRVLLDGDITLDSIGAADASKLTNLKSNVQTMLNNFEENNDTIGQIRSNFKTLLQTIVNTL